MLWSVYWHVQQTKTVEGLVPRERIVLYGPRMLLLLLLLLPGIIIWLDHPARSRDHPVRGHMRLILPELPNTGRLTIYDFHITLLGASFYKFSPYTHAEMRWYHYVSWGAYGFCQGTAAFALFCIGHECDHGSFFGNRSLDNNAVGLMVHSVVLIPYYSWQFTHGKHHAKTAHLVDNSAHNPSTRAEMRKSILAPWVFNLIGETCYTALRIMLYLLFFGWPMYLFTSIEGARRGQLSKATPHAILDHFRPSSKLFPESWSFRVQLSTLGCGLVVAGLCLSGACIPGGFARIILLYGLPYPFFTTWLINCEVAFCAI